MVIHLSPQDSFSLYIHIPFCSKKCDYCHFYVLPDKEDLKDLLLQSLKKEWELWLPLLKNFQLSTIYFGGGTPSLFGPQRIAEILNLVNKSFSLNTPPLEITLEANPENVTQESMRAFKSAGINRVSLGVQSFNDSELTRLSRTHNAKRAIEAISHVYLAGIENISIDLMYDLPKQTNASWTKNLLVLDQLPITHLSLYNLTIEPHTVFYKYKDKIIPDMPNEATSLQLYLEAIKQLENLGLKQYEISAFAKNGAYSKHNTGYWTARPFIGLGPSAFSFFNNDRFQNVPNLRKYAKAIDSKQFATQNKDALTKSERLKELLAVSLRLNCGVNLTEFEKILGKLPQETSETLQTLTEENLLCFSNGFYKLSSKGVLLYDTIASHLI